MGTSLAMKKSISKAVHIQASSFPNLSAKYVRKTRQPGRKHEVQEGIRGEP
jgi:hypothetical protein